MKKLVLISVIFVVFGCTTTRFTTSVPDEIESVLRTNLIKQEYKKAGFPLLRFSDEVEGAYLNTEATLSISSQFRNSSELPDVLIVALRHRDADLKEIERKRNFPVDAKNLVEATKSEKMAQDYLKAFGNPKIVFVNEYHKMGYRIAIDTVFVCHSDNYDLQDVKENFYDGLSNYYCEVEKMKSDKEQIWIAKEKAIFNSKVNSFLSDQRIKSIQKEYGVVIAINDQKTTYISGNKVEIGLNYLTNVEVFVTEALAQAKNLKVKNEQLAQAQKAFGEVLKDTKIDSLRKAKGNIRITLWEMHREIWWYGNELNVSTKLSADRMKELILSELMKYNLEAAREAQKLSDERIRRELIAKAEMERNVYRWYAELMGEESILTRISESGNPKVSTGKTWSDNKYSISKNAVVYYPSNMGNSKAEVKANLLAGLREFAERRFYMCDFK